MFFEVSGITISPWIPPLVSFTISFFTSMGGISGAFLLLPFQISILGFNTPAVSATNHLFNIVAIPSGVYRYIKEGRMVWPLTYAVIVGTLPGVLIGAVLRITYLPDPKNFKIFAGLVLSYIGFRMLKDLVIKKNNSKDNVSSEEKFQKLINKYRKKDYNKTASNHTYLPKVSVKKFNLKRISYEFYGELFDINTLGIMSLCFIVGIVGGVYGIGGGSIIAPFFVSFFKLPIYTVSGAALMGTFVTSVAGVLFYQILAFVYPNMSIAPDLTLGLLFGAGGFAGMYCGARAQKYVPAKYIKTILLICILLTAIKYILAFFPFFDR